MKLNLGSGYRKIDGYINVDNRQECNPDLIFDITDKFPFDDNSIDEIRAYDILEHIPILSTIPVMEEIFRVLKNDGLFEHFTPTCEIGVAAFVDPTHINFWCKQRHLYFIDDTWRNIYNIKAKFAPIKIEDVCTSKELNFYHTHAILRAVK